MSEIDTSAEAVARMLDGVTPGPWTQGKTNPERVSRDGRYIANCDPLHSGKPMTEANARFIAWSRDAVPALAAERDRLAEESARLRDALDSLLDAITATDQIGDRVLSISGSTANLRWLIEAEDDARAALGMS